MTPAQIVSCEYTQKGLDDPTRFEMTVSGWNCCTRSYTYRYEGFVVWYQPFSHNSGAWIAINEPLNLCLEFNRDEPITTMMPVINQVVSDGGDYLLAGLPPTTPDVPEEYQNQSPTERYSLGEV